MKQNIEKRYAQQIYSGVLGKIIGVYLGRPVEGWPYEDIRSRFDEVSYYVHGELGLPLIVSDDDISGTFGFFKAVEDARDISRVTSKDFGHAWLNYIIEDKTILWWGGLGRSTEHTAFLRLKSGCDAPESGSSSRNGKTLSEQIGAQIFIDALAMMCPDDPQKAVHYIGEAARVSHDGTAVQAAQYLGALESMAFSERSIEKLLDRGYQFVSDAYLLKVIDHVRDICSRTNDWREAREHIAQHYGYDKFSGPCHIIPNHSLVLASLILGKDDFHRSVMIASSAAWDTDCNAGNVGCLNGIRLGLEGLNASADLRTPVGDRMLVVTADSGSCVSDAVLETRKIVRAALRAAGEFPAEERKPRFGFDFPGSTQGFEPCPFFQGLQNSASLKSAANSFPGLGVLLENCSDYTPGEISVPVGIDFTSCANNFSTVGSPTLYEGQDIRLCISASASKLKVRPYVLYFKADNTVSRICLEAQDVINDEQLCWRIPVTGGMPIFRLGLSFTSEMNQFSAVVIKYLDWTGAPVQFIQKGSLMSDIWNVAPYWVQAWASSARQFAPDMIYTYCVSHPEENGAVTIGTEDWEDYSASCVMNFSLHDSAGMLVRAKGHRRYVAALFTKGRTVRLVEREHNEQKILAEADCPYDLDRDYSLTVSVQGERVELHINGEPYLKATCSRHLKGAAGFIVNTGTVLVKDFSIRRNFA